jgi:galactonate dehydratase
MSFPAGYMKFLAKDTYLAMHQTKPQPQLSGRGPIVPQGKVLRGGSTINAMVYIANIAAVREAVGPHIGIGADFHGRVHKPMAKVLAKKLDPYKLLFIEEPVLSDNYEALKEIANHSSTPIALGERLFSRWDFKRILSEGYVDILQPDLSHAGGITECRKIATMAEAYDVALAPHCPLGPIALAACLQVDAVSYNAFIQEQSLGIHYNKGNDILDYISNKEVPMVSSTFRMDPDWVSR